MDLEKQVSADELTIHDSPEEFLLLPYREKFGRKREWAKAYFMFWMNNLNPLKYDN
jgi:hypothetical protein